MLVTWGEIYWVELIKAYNIQRKSVGLEFETSVTNQWIKEIKYLEFEELIIKNKFCYEWS